METRQRLKQRNKNNCLKLASWNIRTLLRQDGSILPKDAINSASLNTAAAQVGLEIIYSKVASIYYSKSENDTKELGTVFMLCLKTSGSIIGLLRSSKELTCYV